MAFIGSVLFFYVLGSVRGFLDRAGILDSLFWFESFPERFDWFLRGVVSFGTGYFVSAIVSFVVFWEWIGNLERLERLEEKIGVFKDELKKLEERKKELEGKISELEEKERDYQTKVKKLYRKVENLSKERKELLTFLGELEERKRNLSFYLEEAIAKGYEEGKEKGYRSVITELRSLRAQKSALVDLFSKNRELREVFKKVTGKKLIQFLNEAKKQSLTVRVMWRGLWLLRRVRLRVLSLWIKS